jgi:hypothetical protein
LAGLFDVQDVSTRLREGHTGLPRHRDALKIRDLPIQGKNPATANAMQITPPASMPPATQYHRRDGRIAGPAASRGCPPEVIMAHLPGDDVAIAYGGDA